jgi:hypothetical protein
MKQKRDPVAGSLIDFAPTVFQFVGEFGRWGRVDRARTAAVAAVKADAP